ncbi:MAG: DUF3419 family protein [archaeon]
MKGKKIKEEPMSESAPMYVYATEMISSYYPMLGLKNKKVLTVCGSGDQVLNAYFFGASKVIGFDLNKRCKLITKLKIAALSELDYKDFLKFFGESKVNQGFDYNIYVKLRNKLDRKTKNFFDKLYGEFNLDGKKLARSRYFRQRDYFKSVSKTAINSYIKNIGAYNKMEVIARKIRLEFICEDLKNIAKNRRVAKEKFDIINLSNVPNYFTGKFFKEQTRDRVMWVYDNIFLELRKRLSKNGKIFYYGYSPADYPNNIASKIPPISKNYNVNRMKARKEFKIIQRNIKGLNYNTKDKIIILEKA